MSVAVISFLVSLLISLWLIRYNHLHSHFTADYDLSGVQKFHFRPVPRIGGLGIFLGLLFAFVVCYFQNSTVGIFGLLLLACSIPAFIFGILEDITKRIGVKTRLLASVTSAILAGYFMGGWLTSVQVLGIDNLMLTFPLVAIGITCFAVSGVANAFNIIDGYNGLASMVAVIILGGIVYVAFQVGDTPVMITAIALMGALSGFLVWNYPRGLIFMGDGGAYLMGFWIAELSILLTSRHPQVSKWFPMLLCIYPIFETIFTIYRRVFLKRAHPGMPDSFHLHQLIYRRVVLINLDGDDRKSKIDRNSMTSPYLWLLCLMAVIPAVLFWRNHILLKLFTTLFIITYIWIYWVIVRFKTPNFLIFRKANSDK